MPRPDLHRRNRHGIATLEFVLVFPMLLALVAGLFLVARADVSKTLTATQARNELWQRERNANPGAVLALGNDPARSLVAATPSNPVRGGSLFPNGFTARSKAATTGRTWDYRDVPFGSVSRFMGFHIKELGLITAGLAQAPGILGNLNTFLGQLKLPGVPNPLSSEALAGRLDEVEQDLNRAKQKVNKIRDAAKGVRLPGLLGKLKEATVDKAVDAAAKKALQGLDTGLNELTDLRQVLGQSP